MDPRQGAPAPPELKTTEGDGRLGIELRRMTDVEMAAIARNALSPKRLVDRLDADGDGGLALEEYLADWPGPQAVKQGTEAFGSIDRDDDGRVTVEELNDKTMKAVFLLLDWNADGVLTPNEFTASGSFRSAPSARARRVFDVTDRDDDGALSFHEYTSRPAESWFIKLDANEDERLSRAEYTAGNQGLARVGRLDRVFTAIDRNGDGTISPEEFKDKPFEVFFVKLDRDRDDRLSFKEYLRWKRTAEQVASAKEEFAGKDTDGDGFLTYREYAYRSDDAAFWNADRDGDDRLSLAEFRASRPGQPEETAQAAFRAMDQNGDGQIRLGEFKRRPPADEPSTQGDAP
jgi:Ca2+-binding EF-hand superfamily protein